MKPLKFKVDINEAGFEDAVDNGTAPVIKSFILDLRNRMLVSFTTPKHGERYKRGGKSHQASAPGEAPAVDFGTLQNSIIPEFPSPTLGILEIGAEHGLYLTTGTQNMEKRPFIEPAILGALEGLGL